jgi:hypothetical protein
LWRQGRGSHFPEVDDYLPWNPNLSHLDLVVLGATTNAIGGYMTEEFSSAEAETPAEVEKETGGRERYKVVGEKLLSKVKELLQQGNIRRITIKNGEDKTLIEIPLTIGVVGAAIFPVWAAVGAIAALVTDCSIEVERHEPDEQDS